ncbi:MAG: A/G-specific adenine glycosylase [Gammaproteobacteria bacterium]|nr:A/G-specific adenine glycosylase [Gammaproteobacteria bacterium]
MDLFAERLVRWHKRHGRHDLPWQQTRDPYTVWLSEIMLQQTQVSSVIPYFLRFIARFPDIAALAAASPDEVLAHWSGLGYYARGRNLHRAAQLIMERHGGVFPDDFDPVAALPGIGRSTAAAILAFSFGQKRAILDGNVKRVLARCFGIDGYPGAKAVENALWQKAEQLLPDADIETYTQALMDLGATVCTRARPRCASCPFSGNCVAYNENRVAELPASRPRKALPHKETVMLILLRQGEVFLEKRPSTGIWGGMWSFPEAAREDGLRDVCMNRFGFEVSALDPWPEFEHAFTHFRLNILPRPLLVTAIQPQVRQPDGLWLHPMDALEAAIPTPVRRLLRQMEKDRNV